MKEYNPFKRVSSPFATRIKERKEPGLKRLTNKVGQITEKDISALPSWEDKMKEWGLK